MAAGASSEQNTEARQPPKEPSFELSLSELETIVAQLEAGEKPLDESLALYEKGIAALKRCHIVLDKAEKRIRMLVKGPDGEPVLREGDVPRAGRSGARGDAQSSGGADVVAEQPAAGTQAPKKRPVRSAGDANPSPRSNPPHADQAGANAGETRDAGGSLFGGPK